MAIVVMAIVRSSSTQQAFAPAAVVTSVPQTIGAPQLVTSTPEQTTTSPDETALPTLTTDPLHPPQTVSPDQLTVAVGLMHDLDFSKAAVVYCCETSASDESLSVDESLSHTVELSGQLIVLPDRKSVV